MATFTDAGKALVTKRLKFGATGVTEPNNIGWGTGTTGELAAQTTLVTEAAPTTSGGRTAGTSSQATKTVTNDTYQVVGTVTASGSVAITEAGLFDAASGGNMLARALFSAINLVLGDSIQFTFAVTFA